MFPFYTICKKSTCIYDVHHGGPRGNLRLPCPKRFPQISYIHGLTYNSVYQQSQDSVVVQFASFWSLLTPRQSSEIPAASTRSPQCFSYPVAETRSSGSKLSTLAVANFLSKSSTLALPCSRQRRVCLYLLSFCTGAASLVVKVFWCAQHK